MAGGEVYDQRAMKRDCWTARYNQAASRNAGKRRDGFFDLASFAHFDGA